MVYLLCTVYTVIKTWEEGAIVGWKRNDRVHPDWRRVKYCYQKMENDSRSYNYLLSYPLTPQVSWIGYAIQKEKKNTYDSEGAEGRVTISDIWVG